MKQSESGYENVSVHFLHHHRQSHDDLRGGDHDHALDRIQRL